jgi:hypothetical protein
MLSSSASIAASPAMPSLYCSALDAASTLSHNFRFPVILYI